MKAVIFNEYGSSSVLEYKDMEKPDIQPAQVLIKVKAASVNPVDWKIRKGMLKIVHKIRFPFIGGCDVCGEVEAAGSDVAKFRKGDMVYAMLGLAGGAYAEYAAVSESIVSLKPEGLHDTEAAAIPLAGLTALQALRDKGGISEGKNVMIIGASGGVGHLAVQIAKADGAKVTAVCGTENVSWVKDLGADRVIDYKKDDYTNLDVKYDIIFDAVATYGFSKLLKILAAKGVYISTLPKPDLFIKMPVLLIFSKKRAKFIMVRPVAEDLDYLSGLVKEGKLRPVIDKTYSLMDTAASQDYSEEGHAKGKISIEISE